MTKKVVKTKDTVFVLNNSIEITIKTRVKDEVRMEQQITGGSRDSRMSTIFKINDERILKHECEISTFWDGVGTSNNELVIGGGKNRIDISVCDKVSIDASDMTSTKKTITANISLGINLSEVEDND